MNVDQDTVTILTLDLGVTTGWAVFVGSDVMDYGQTTTLESALPSLLTRWLPDIVVVEQPLATYRGELAEQLKKGINLAKYFLEGARRTVEWIEPSDWKPTPAARTMCPKGTSQHEKDAIRIGHWYRRFRLQG